LNPVRNDRYNSGCISEYYRTFEAGPDPFGATWKAEFRWAQNAISIRHADTIDVKFEITCGEIHEEKIIALPHPMLLKASHATEQPVTDPWVNRIAALHLKKNDYYGRRCRKDVGDARLRHDPWLRRDVASGSGYARSLSIPATCNGPAALYNG